MNEQSVGCSFPKKDAEAVTAGAAVYTDDIAPEHCLIIKLLRSPYANAMIESIDVSKAYESEGVVCVLTWEDVPQIRFTYAGQCYPESSPYDRYILENHVRYIGDPVAIVAAVTEKAAETALKKIKVKYKVMDAVADFEKALDSSVIIHSEPDYHNNVPIGGDPCRNLICSHYSDYGDADSAFESCDVTLEDTFYTKANAQAMMETFRTCAYYDYQHRLTIISSTQVPFHCRRIIAMALNLPQSKVRVIKPRVGGGFGAKQSLVTEVITAFVTNKTGRPSKLILSRKDCFTASNSRHQMRLHVKMGATKDGIVRAIELDVLANGGAYGEQSYPTSLLVGHKTIPLYAHAAYKHKAEFVYTNLMPAGAYRGFGATQGCYAVETMANRMAHVLGIDAAYFRIINIPAAGEKMPAYFGDVLLSSKLKRCIETGCQRFHWKERCKPKETENGRIRAVGMAITMQGSGVPMKDVCCATIHLNDTGFYTLQIGAADIGTGCDTVLSQIAAQVLECSINQIIPEGVDTDHSPYDKGSYASSTTYVSGQAVMEAALSLKEKIIQEGAARLKIKAEDCWLDGQGVHSRNDETIFISLKDLSEQLVLKPDCDWLTATADHCCIYSAPPFMAGFAEVEVDRSTGKVLVTDFLGVIDCGTVINPALACAQAQGGIVQGIGMALYEDTEYTDTGKIRNNSFFQY